MHLLKNTLLKQIHTQLLKKNQRLVDVSIFNGLVILPLWLTTCLLMDFSSKTTKGSLATMSPTSKKLLDPMLPTLALVKTLAILAYSLESYLVFHWFHHAL